MLNPIMQTIALGSPVNWQSPVNRSLVAWWYCLPQTLGGIYWPDMCKRLNAKRVNLAAFSWAYNHRGGLASFNLSSAASNYMSIEGYDSTANDPFSIGNKNFCVCAWIRPTAVNSYQIVIGRDDDSTHRDLILGFGNTTGAILYMTGRTNPGSASPKQSGNVIIANEWNHIGAMRVGTTLTLWHNGAQVQSDTDSETTVVIQTTSIGRRNYAGFPQYYNGRLNDVRYHAGTSVPTPGEIYAASIKGYINELNYVDRLALFVGSGAAATNRRRRLLLSRAR